MFLAAVLILSLIASSRSDEGSVIELSAKQLYKGRKCGAFDLLVDVRTTSEFDSGHIEGATLIESLATRDVTAVPELMNCKNCRIAVYCRSGSRAGFAARKLVEAGFTDVSNGGGINDWMGRGYAVSLAPSVPTNCPTTTCAASATTTTSSQTLRSSGMCPITLAQLKKSARKTGSDELVALLPFKNTEIAEYCNSLRDFRRKIDEMSAQGTLSSVPTKLKKKMKKRARRLMIDAQCVNK